MTANTGWWAPFVTGSAGKPLSIGPTRLGHGGGAAGGCLEIYRFPSGTVYRRAQNVPNDVIESAWIDGANRWQVTRHIVLPDDETSYPAFIIL